MEISQAEYERLVSRDSIYASQLRDRARRRHSPIMGILISMGCIAVLIGIGYAQWPAIKAAYYADVKPAQAAPAPADTSEADKLKAANARLEAQLRAAQAAPQQAPVIVQSVPAGEAPQHVTIPAQPAPIVANDNGVAPDQSAPAAPIIIVHQVSADGTHQSVTGPGACAVGGSVARRCGK